MRKGGYPLTYFNIHAHTDYSNIRGLDSTNTVEGLITLSHQLGLKGVCITDHETLSGHVKALQFISKKKKDEDWHDFKVGLGNEIYLCRDDLNTKNYTKGEDGFWHFILVAKDSVGHKQLRQLSSRAWQRSFYQFIERVPTYYRDIEEVVGADPGHLIASTACLGGYFPKLILAEKFTQAQSFIRWGQSIFGEDFYIELQPGLSTEQKTFNRLALDFAKIWKVKPIITTDAHYPRQKDRPIHKAFLTSNESEREVDAFYESTFSMSGDEIIERFDDDLKESAKQCLANTLEIYDKIEEYSLNCSQIIPRVPFNWSEIKTREESSEYEYINKFLISPHEEDRFYIQLVLQGAHSKGIFDAEHLSRINTELEQIWKISETQNQRLSTYFLTVRKVIDIMWNSGSIVGDGRGSVATHVCSYCTDIIQFDPLKSPIELPYWRFLSYERPEYPDIDIDFEASKREKVIANLKSYFQSIGGDLVAVATFGTTTSKSALQSAARGLGYEPEIGTYLSSLIPIDRGFVRTLKQCYYGDEEKGYTPVSQFVKEMNTFQDIWEVAQGIEGLINRRGRHACGVLPVNGDFTEHNAIMKAPDGGLISQWELHDSEAIGGMKFDALTTDFLDRIHCCLDLLSEYGYIEWQTSLRDTYNKYLNPSVIRYDEPAMWDMAIQNKVSSLFQFDTPSGLQTIKLVKPHSLGELAQANSLMRLMPEGRDKTPTEEYIAYKNNMQLFYSEIERLNGTQEEKGALLEILEPLYGVADGQEAAMRLLMHPKLFGFSIKEGHGARKLIAKKQIKEISNYRENLFKIAKEKGISEDVVHYIWDVQIGRQLGYSFSYPHTISYSIIAVQALNLAYYYPIIYWNTACLIVDSDGLQDDDVEIVNDDIDIDEETDSKKKVKPIRYDKISTAIGKMVDSGIKVIPPNINRSKYTFTPDEENDSIMYGLRGITRINADIANIIIENRPYSSFDDFNDRVHLQTLPTLNLIKSGSFDEFEDRTSLMSRYIEMIADQKKKLTLANLGMLINYGLVPDEYKFYEQLFNFHKYLKTTKVGIEYCLDNYSLSFYEKHFDTSQLSYLDGDGGRISSVVWDKMYKKSIEGIKKWLGLPETLNLLNTRLYQDVFNKYAEGSISKWEMDSIGFYYHEHELNELETKYLGLSNFNELPEDPEIDNTFITKTGQRIFIYKLHRFAGTVIGKDKLKNIVTLLTPDGVVKVKVYRPQFSKYDRQIAEKNEVTGKKTIVERSWFTRGNILIVTGIRRGDFVVPKYYKNTPYQPFELITNIDYEHHSFSVKEERDAG